MNVYKITSPEIFDEEYYKFHTTFGVEKIMSEKLEGTIVSSNLLNRKRSISFFVRKSNGEHSITVLSFSFSNQKNIFGYRRDINLTG